MNRQLIHGDSAKELKKFDDNSVDLLCTDPPYGYGFMGRDWDKVLPDIKIFEECFRVLKPGALAFVMSAPRSDVQYRMAEMLERVGFRIDYTPIYWTYASGFPKAMNMGKMLDKVGRDKKELDGSYGGFQPKPAVEVVIVAMKPIEEKGLLAQAQKNGKAVSWFDDCRIPFDEGDDYDSYVDKQKSFKGSETIGTTIKGNEHFLGGDIKQLDPSENFVDESAGRFPANMLVSDKVLDDYSRYFSLDEWFSKNLKSLPEPVQKTFPFMIVPKASKAEKNNGLDNFDTKQTTGGGGGVGDYIDDVNSASGKFGSEKAPSRNIHPTVKPLTLMNYLVVLGSRKGDVVLEPFAGSGTTALACVSQERDYIAIEREEEYYEIAKARLDKVEQPLKMWEKFSG